jgi:cation diffusion facilitator CzcD-associated flavoprotein CzcO
MPASYGRYPPRAQFVDYLESYAAKFSLKPKFNAAVSAVRRAGGLWRVEAGAHSAGAPIVVIATGSADFPFSPKWPGMDSFEGPIVHSSAYRNPAPYRGKRELVVGFGNSGAEVALDLCEAQVDVTLSVRSPVCIVPRELLGVPIVSLSILQRFLPPRAVDAVNAPVLRLAVGSIESLGMRRSSKGPVTMVREDRRIPVIDIGAVAKIRAGAIKVRGGVESFAPEGLKFVAGQFEPFDAVILATGFQPDLRAVLPEVQGVLDDKGVPLITDGPSAGPGLYFIGAIPSPTGQLRQIGVGAARIAADAKRYLERERAAA